MKMNHWFHQIRIAILKKSIKHNPYIGSEDIDGTYLYKKDGYSIRYRIINRPQGKIGIEWVSQRRRFSIYEERIKRIKKGFFDFWHYQRWLILFKPGILLVIITGILLFYFEVMETQETKMARLKWLIASVAGVDHKEIQYIGDGYLEISGQRKKADRIETIRYTFNPLSWLFFSSPGFLTRWRGRPFGYATHPIIYNKKGEIWINKEGAWQHGRISGESIKWDTPQGSAGIAEQKISIEDKEFKIIDKQ